MRTIWNFIFLALLGVPACSNSSGDVGVCPTGGSGTPCLPDTGTLSADASAYGIYQCDGGYCCPKGGGLGGACATSLKGFVCHDEDCPRLGLKYLLTCDGVGWKASTLDCDAGASVDALSDVDASD